MYTAGPGGGQGYIVWLLVGLGGYILQVQVGGKGILYGCWWVGGTAGAGWASWGVLDKELQQACVMVMESFCWAGEQFLAGLSQVCNNVMGHLNTKGLYPTLEVSPICQSHLSVPFVIHTCQLYFSVTPVSPICQF